MHHRVTALQIRLNDRSLTLLLVVQLFLIFGVAPVLSSGIPVPDFVWALAFFAIAVLAIVASRRTKPAIAVMIALSISGIAATIRQIRDTPLTDWMAAGGTVLALGAVSWVVAERVFAPGRMNIHRVIGAVALYMNFALLFTSLYRLVAALLAGSFEGLPAVFDRTKSVGDLVYFSMATLTTVGYGDIVPLHPIARSLVNLEAMVGQLYPAIILARIVTLYDRNE
jgi:hypothetical protein